MRDLLAALVLLSSACSQTPTPSLAAESRIAPAPHPDTGTTCTLSLTAPVTFQHDYSSAVATDLCSYGTPASTTRVAFFQTKNTTPAGTGLGQSISVTLGPLAVVGTPMTLQGNNPVDSAYALFNYTNGSSQCMRFTGTATLVSD